MTPLISSLRRSNGPASKQATSYLMWFCSEPYIRSMQAGLIMESMQRSAVQCSTVQCSTILTAGKDKALSDALAGRKACNSTLRLCSPESSRLMMRLDLEV